MVITVQCFVGYILSLSSLCLSFSLSLDTRISVLKCNAYTQRQFSSVQLKDLWIMKLSTACSTDRFVLRWNCGWRYIKIQERTKRTFSLHIPQSPAYCLECLVFVWFVFVLEITALQASHVTNKHTGMGVCIHQLGCQRRPGVDIAMQFTPGAVPPSAYPAASCVLFGVVRLPGSSVQRWPPFSLFLFCSLHRIRCILAGQSSDPLELWIPPSYLSYVSPSIL